VASVSLPLRSSSNAQASFMRLPALASQVVVGRSGRSIIFAARSRTSAASWMAIVSP
jgi:hypothetical protein